MDQYADIYYVDTRNADGRDHRTGNTGGGGFMGAVRPGTMVQPSGYAPRPAYGPQPVMYTQAPMAPTFASTLFGKLTTGQVIDMVAQLFAALQPLPTSPIATKDATTDVGNLILFQGALAQHAKRDEQVRTLGGLVAKLVG